jgi:hypothetical protein
MTWSPAQRLELYSLLHREAPSFGPRLSALAAQRGLAVTNASDGSARPIPITATPVIVDSAELQRRQRLASHLASAGLKMSRALLEGPHADLALGGLSPLERTLALRTFASLTTLVTTRVDFFVASGVSALELNATIPAMQGYSDIAADSFLEVVGRHFGASDERVADWRARNGSNSRALFQALEAGFEAVRPGQRPQRIALLCRRNDAQLTEQRSLCERFCSWGADAAVVHPDQLSGEDCVRANGKVFDLVYRHLFVRRLEEPGLAGADYVKSLLAEPNGRRAVVLNPPATQVEVKLVFASISQALEDSSLARAAGLDEAELEAILEAVPWTRAFRGASLVAQVAADPDRYVLKRSWDYGGRAVFVGRTRAEPSFAERVRAAYGEPLDWPTLCHRAADDPAGGGFVVQELVDAQPEVHLLCEGQTQRALPLYVDFSAYASVGLTPQPAWGGVCRGSSSHIVNIVGGGGVIPLLTSEVASALLETARGR